MKTCSVEGCNKIYYAKGFCKNHYDTNRFANDSELRKRTNDTKRKKYYEEKENSTIPKDRTQRKLYFEKKYGKPI